MDSLSDFELRKMLVDYGVHDGPVTPTTRHVLQNRLSKVLSQHSERPQVEVTETQSSETYSETYSVEEVLDTAACLVTEDAGTDPCEDTPEPYQRHTEIHETPVYDPSAEATSSEVKEARTTLTYESYTPNTQGLRYARNSYPCSDDLRRRPLNTPKQQVVEHTRSERVATVKSAPVVVVEDAASKSSVKSWLCNRFFLILLLVVVCFLVLVYYHMEHNEIQLIPGAQAGESSDVPPTNS